MQTPLPASSRSRRKLIVGGAVLGLVTVSGAIFALTRDPESKPADAIVYELASSDVVTVRPQPLT
jgi:hypothetical protein